MTTPTTTPGNDVEDNRHHGFSFGAAPDGTGITFDWAADPHLLVTGNTGTGKSTVLQTLTTEALLSGAECYLGELEKNGADFRFAEPWLKQTARTVSELNTLLTHVFNEVKNRRILMSKLGVSTYSELPVDSLPRRIVVVVDEFANLSALSSSSSASAEEIAEARACTTLLSKLARESRSAGVTLLVASQRIQTSLGRDLELNAAQLLLGPSTQLQRQTALPWNRLAPDLGNGFSRGSGLFETSHIPTREVQCWYGSDYVQQLQHRLNTHLPVLASDYR